MSEPMAATRREFIRNGLTLVSTAATVPAFLDRTARAMGSEAAGPRRRTEPSEETDRILVVLQLAGGNDGLNTVIPYRDDAYYRARPQIAIARKDALPLTDELGLHPSATGLKQLYDAGLLAIVQGVGYPNPDRSHFKGTDIWETGDPMLRSSRGWIGKYFDCSCKGTDPPDPRKAIALTQEIPLALQGERFSPVAFSSPDQLDWRPGRTSPSTREAFEQLNQPDDDHTPDGRLKPDAMLDYLTRTALDARMASHDIMEAAGGDSRRGAGPRAAGSPGRGGALTAQLQMVARMIAANLPTRVYYVSFGSFDTHAGQVGRHQQLLRELGEALEHFFNDLHGSRQVDRVLLMTFSEFGRRVEQNASQGTDHGAAAPLFLAGPAVRAGLFGPAPDLRRLDRGDVAWSVDFRSIYATVLSKWLRADAARILGGRFKPLDLLQTR